MASVKEIIRQAFDIANVVPYGQTLSDARLAEGLRLLIGNVARYSNDDLLCVYEDMLEIKPTSKEFRIGPDAYCGKSDNGYSWLVIAHKSDYDAVKDKVTETASEIWQDDRLVLSGTAVYVQETQSWYYLKDGKMVGITGEFEFNDGTLGESVNPNQYMPIWKCNITKIKSISMNGQLLNFVPLANWTERYSYSWTQKDIGKCLSILLEVPALKEVTLVWNKGIDLTIQGLDVGEANIMFLSENLDIPTIYEQLLVWGLAVSLSLKYPRQDDAQMTRLQAEYANILNNCRTPLANRRMITRSSSGAYDLLSGRGLY